MTRTSSISLLLLVTLCWVGTLSTAAQAQVEVGVDVGVDTSGTVNDPTGPAGDAVGGAVEALAPEAGAGRQALDQNGAIEAVRTHRAMPLEKIMTMARFHTAGDIVDAQLISVNGFLLYELKVIEADGDVGALYFYALSGELVRTK